MGTSYQTLLMVAGMDQVRAVLAAAGVRAWLVPAGADRVAVMPQEGDYDYADTVTLAERVSREGYPALSNDVHDSDVVIMTAFRDGREVHRYASDQAMLVDWFIDDDDVCRFRIGEVEYPAGAPAPQGPLGADPDALAPFGVGTVDLSRLGAALRGEFQGQQRVFAEFQHRLILNAMNLDPRGLTLAYRWARAEDLPGGVHVTPASRVSAMARDWTEWPVLGLVLNAVLPASADNVEAGRAVANAALSLAWPVRARVGCTQVLPGAAGALELLASSRRLGGGRSAIYFIALHVQPGPGRPDDETLAVAAQTAWRAALQPYPARLEVLRVEPHQFQIGYDAAVQYLP